MALMRKWIAKMMSILDYYINESIQDKNISFGSEDIHFADQIVDDNYDSLDTSNYVYIYKHEDISDLKGLSV